MKLLAIPLLLLAGTACGGGGDVDCDDGFEERDGLCYEEGELGDDDDNSVGPMTPAKFNKLFYEIFCAEMADCNPDIECSDGGSTTMPECTFDAAMARQCLNGEYVCDDSFGEGFEFVIVPAACAEVYDCGGGTYGYYY